MSGREVINKRSLDFVPEDAAQVLKTLDAMGIHLTEHGFDWTDEMKNEFRISCRKLVDYCGDYVGT